jgi:hypothetical protein
MKHRTSKLLRCKGKTSRPKTLSVASSLLIPNTSSQNENLTNCAVVGPMVVPCQDERSARHATNSLALHNELSIASS